MVDMAHIAGLVAAGVHMSPVPYADVVTSTTHKTLRGPRGGLILCKNEITKKNIETGEMETINLAKKIDSAVFPGTQGGPLEHIIAAKAICFGEALKPEFKAYGEQVVKNAAVLADGLMKDEEIYNVFNTQKILGKKPTVSISNTSGAAGIAYWINAYYGLTGSNIVEKSDDVVRAVKDMVDAEYAAGRNTIMGDDELDSMVRLYDKDLHKLFNDRINKKKLGK